MIDLFIFKKARRVEVDSFYGRAFEFDAAGKSERI